MGQRAGVPGLGTEPLLHLGVPGELGPEQLDRHRPGQDGVFRTPDLADPAYRGETSSLLRQMRFQYTGWLRAQKLLPMSSLKVGNNDLIIVSGPGTPVSAIRATQVQLKYLWDKSDYILKPDR